MGHFQKMLACAPVNKAAAFAVRQDGVTDSFLTPAKELQNEVDAPSKQLDLIRAALGIPGKKTSALKLAIAQGILEVDNPELVRYKILWKRRNRLSGVLRAIVQNAVGDFKGLQVGDRFTVMVKGSGCYTDTVSFLSAGHFKGTITKTTFSRRTGKANTKAIHAMLLIQQKEEP